MRKTIAIALALVMAVVLCAGGVSVALASQPTTNGDIINGDFVDGDSDVAGGEGDIIEGDGDVNGGDGDIIEGDDGGNKEEPVQSTIVSFEGREIIISNSSDGHVYHETDLFGGFKDVMPGDNLEQVITFTNKGSYTVGIYLKAQAHDDENPLAHEADAGDRQETIASMSEFLSKLTLQIVDGETREVLYKSTPDDEAPEEDEGSGDSDIPSRDNANQDSTTTQSSSSASMRTMGMRASADDELGLMAGGSGSDDTLSLLALGEDDTEGVLLIKLKPGESRSVIMMLSVPSELGNEYANRVGEVDWLFTFSEETGGGVGGGGDPVDPSDPDDPDSPDDPAQPDDPNQPENPSGPQGPLPITGDNAPIVLALCGLILATIFMLLAVIMKRRRER